MIMYIVTAIICHRFLIGNKINYAQIWIEISEEMYKDIKEIKDNLNIWI